MTTATSPPTPTAALSAAGVSIWLDDLSRERIASGGLQKLIAEKDVVGVTTNPTIFAAALATGEAYADQVRQLAAAGASVEDAIFEITTDDVAAASDAFCEIYEATAGVDGRVSIEVEPGLAHDAAATIEQAKALADRIGKPNVLIKIPATVEGLEAIAETIAAGISVNVTLIFSLERYRQVIDAYLTGLEKARAAGIDLAGIHSVASFFVSRVDSEIDKRLSAIGSEEALALRGKAGIANARLAYEVYEQAFSTERATALVAAGGNRQRPLWASTGVKDPSLPDTLYVTELVAPNTVNTMPEKTLDATFGHAVIVGDTVTGAYAAAKDVLTRLAALGVDYDDVTATLEREGVHKFAVSWGELMETVKNALEAARASQSARTSEGAQ